MFWIRHAHSGQALSVSSRRVQAGASLSVASIAVASLFGWCGGDGNFTRLRLIAHAGSTDFRFLRLGVRQLRGFFAILVAWTVTLTTALLAAALVPVQLSRTAALTASLALLRGGLVHQVEHTEIVFRILQVALSHHAVAAARRVAAQLQVFLEQLLRGPANANVRTAAVEDVVAVEWDAAASIMAHSAAATSAASATTSTATSARAVIAATHAFHVHTVAVVLSRCGAA
jgi:hypothetical protein